MNKHSWKRRIASVTPAILFALYFSPSAWAQHDMSRWEDMFSQQPAEFRMRYGMTSYFDEPIKSQDKGFSLIEQDFSASAQVWSDAHDDVSIHGSLRYEEIHTTAILPDTGIPFPDQLWSINMGVTYRYLFENGSVLGGTVNVGSASDHPFESSQEITESVMAFFRTPAGDHDFWLFFLAYSNNRDYANSIPIPGVEYLYNPSPEFHAMVGFPMEMVEWRPTEDLSLRCSYSLIHSIHALVIYKLGDPVRLYAGFDWNTQGYLLVDRPDPKDRFFYDEKRAKVGEKLTLTKGLVLDLSGGYAFDRSYRESQHGLRSWFDRVDVANGFYAMASIEFVLGGSRVRYEPEKTAEPDNTD